MKSLRITLPLAVAVILVVATEFFHLSGAPLVISWVVGFLFSMITTTVIEVRLRMKKFVEEKKGSCEKTGGTIMFITTTGINAGYTIKDVVEATASLMLSSEDIDKYNMFDQLFDESKEKIKKKAELSGGDGIIGLKYNSEVVELNGAPKFLVVHAYGTVVVIDK